MYSFYNIKKSFKKISKLPLPLVRDEDSTNMSDMLSGAKLRMTGIGGNGVNSRFYIYTYG